jgi:hypothetical protein
MGRMDKRLSGSKHLVLFRCRRRSDARVVVRVVFVILCEIGGGVLVDDGVVVVVVDVVVVVGAVDVVVEGVVVGLAVVAA